MRLNGLEGRRGDDIMKGLRQPACYIEADGAAGGWNARRDLEGAHTVIAPDGARQTRVRHRSHADVRTAGHREQRRAQHERNRRCPAPLNTSIAEMKERDACDGRASAGETTAAAAKIISTASQSQMHGRHVDLRQGGSALHWRQCARL